MIKKPYLCIFHDGCIDGFGAAYSIYSSKLGTEVEFVPGVFDNEPPDVKNRHVILVDFSYKKDLMVQLSKESLSISIFDHHESAAQELQPLLDAGIIAGTFDSEKSGAMISWEHFHPNEPIPDIIKYIQDKDLNYFKLPFSQEVNASLATYSHEFCVWDELATMEYTEFITDGKAILKKYRRDLERLIPVVTRTLMIGGHLVPAANVPYFMASDVGYQLARGVPFAATYYDTERFRVFSLRSLDTGINVSEVALAYSGGGNPRSAGFRVALSDTYSLEPFFNGAC